MFQGQKKKDKNRTVCGRFRSGIVGESWVSRTTRDDRKAIIENDNIVFHSFRLNSRY